MFTIETSRVSIADSCIFHLNLTCRNATNHCPRASFPLIHGSRRLQCHKSPLKDIFCKFRYIVAKVLWRNDQTISISIKYAPLSYRTGGNRKRSERSMNAYHISLETVFWIAICRHFGDRWQSKALFLVSLLFDLFVYNPLIYWYIFYFANLIVIVLCFFLYVTLCPF